jgi:hypothetical protein
MKKFISLVVVVLVLSSFINKNDVKYSNEELEKNSTVEKKRPESIDDYCFSYASAVADEWMTNTGGSWSDSVPTFNQAQSDCYAVYDALVIIGSYLP